MGASRSFKLLNSFAIAPQIYHLIDDFVFVSEFMTFWSTLVKVIGDFNVSFGVGVTCVVGNISGVLVLYFFLHWLLFMLLQLLLSLLQIVCEEVCRIVSKKAHDSARWQNLVTLTEKEQE